VLLVPVGGHSPTREGQCKQATCVRAWAGRSARICASNRVCVCVVIVPACRPVGHSTTCEGQHEQANACACTSRINVCLYVQANLCACV